VTDVGDEGASPGTVARLRGERAGFFSRGAAFAIDFVVVLLGYPAMFWGIGFIVGLLQFEQPSYPDLPPAVSAAVYTTWVVTYFAGSWLVTARTLGQALLGLRVVKRRRRSIPVLWALIRCWVMLLTVFVVGPVWLLVSRSRLAIHDRAAGTEVIYDWPPRQATVTVDLGVKEGAPR
jgi:uncharacterized RDD family membrane protein YckC